MGMITDLSSGIAPTMRYIERLMASLLKIYAKSEDNQAFPGRR